MFVPFAAMRKGPGRRFEKMGRRLWELDGDAEDRGRTLGVEIGIWEG
jgi:hypothetical protein